MGRRYNTFPRLHIYASKILDPVIHRSHRQADGGTETTSMTNMSLSLRASRGKNAARLALWNFAVDHQTTLNPAKYTCTAIGANASRRLQFFSPEKCLTVFCNEGKWVSFRILTASITDYRGTDKLTIAAPTIGPIWRRPKNISE